MLDHPYYIRLSTDNDEPHFARPSAAEVVATALMNAQFNGWLRLHGFVVLPESLEMVATPIRQGVAGVVGYLQAETIPLLAVLLPNAGFIWARRYAQTPLANQRTLDARLNMLLLAPVAAGLVDNAERYPYSSANPRYVARVSVYAGFAMQGSKTGPLPVETVHILDSLPITPKVLGTGQLNPPPVPNVVPHSTSNGASPAPNPAPAAPEHDPPGGIYTAIVHNTPTTPPLETTETPLTLLHEPPFNAEDTLLLPVEDSKPRPTNSTPAAD